VKNLIASLLCVCGFVAPSIAYAQVPIEPASPPPASPQLPAPSATNFWTPFIAVPRDFVHFFSMDTARIFGVSTAAGMVVHRWDDDGIVIALGRFKPLDAFRAGNVGGGMYAQLGGAFAVYAIGKATRVKGIAEIGGDLFRAQMLTQGVVQVMKVSFQRPRPDGSNNFSLPSGHTAGAVATATVLQRHYGWKAGLPAYTASAYVAAARMAANKHHLTDVMTGAAVGLAAGRTVTIGVAKRRFSVGVAPTAGGAAVTITKEQ
jgi:membrane-associated phospholipid phosphatase